MIPVHPCVDTGTQIDCSQTLSCNKEFIFMQNDW